MISRFQSSAARPAARHVLFGIYALSVALVNVRALAALFEYSRTNVSASHIVLVPFVTMFLIYERRRAIFAAAGWSPQAGGLTVAAGVALLLLGSPYGPFGRADYSLVVTAASLVVLWIGGFLWCYGPRAGGAALFPLFFLAFMIPIPAPALDAAILVLKTGTTEMVAVLFTLTGTTYHRQEFTFALRDFVIFVADECSGIRSSIALVLTTLLAGHMFLRTAWRKGVLVALVVPITMFKNAIRIVALTLLATHVNPSFLTGQLHREGGIAFYLFALALLAPALHFLRRSENTVRGPAALHGATPSTGQNV